jgi:hypothetical protein
MCTYVFLLWQESLDMILTTNLPHFWDGDVTLWVQLHGRRRRSLDDSFGLWVLDVCYTCSDHILSAQMMDVMTQLRELNVIRVENWDIGQLKGRLPNIRKLQVTKSTIAAIVAQKMTCSWRGTKMELLNFSGNKTISPMNELIYWPWDNKQQQCRSLISSSWFRCREIEANHRW